jgi:hypothetical protein
VGQFVSGEIVPFNYDTNRDVVILCREVVYVDDAGREWVAPRCMESDGTSMPRVLWSRLGHPFLGVRFKPSLIHDSAYQCALPEESGKWAAFRSKDRKAADDVYLAAMADEGDEQRWAVYWGVRLGGWLAWSRWAKRNAKLQGESYG